MDLFWKQEEITAVSEEPKKVESSVPPVNAASGQTDENIAASLSEALQVANIEGYDYFEYAKTLDALKPTITAEQTLFQTAFASASVMGVTKQKLIDTAQHYLGVLDKKSSEFEEAMKTKIGESVTGKENESKSMDGEIKSRAETIQKLTEEINQLQAKKTQLTNEASDNRIKIERVRNNFAATLQIFVEKIKSDLEKINKYLA